MVLAKLEEPTLVKHGIKKCKLSLTNHGVFFFEGRPTLETPDVQLQARQSLKHFDAEELLLGVRCCWRVCLNAGYFPKWPMSSEHYDSLFTSRLPVKENLQSC